MSFCLTARGARDEVLATLGQMPVYGQLGADVLSLVVTTVRAGADRLGDDPLEYEVYMAGHEDAVIDQHSVPNLAVRITATRQPTADAETPHGPASSSKDRPVSNQELSV